ncbi:tenascin isoform X1 [Clarias gariepinus]|uniref:tenascin isoform X1 n=1 Tax=Clarias gariepinus TaxID=13013 RepID=UPI00234C7F57|nr:tenascin isoform X1 [Clarias gariepinus]
MPFLLRLILFLIPSPALLSRSASLPSEPQPVKMVISERCVSDPNTVEGQEVDLTPGSPLVLTHRIRLVPSAASGPCCKAEYAALHERIEALEREVSELREKCGGPDGGCCTSQQSRGAGCTTDQCLNDCNDQGRCVDGKCVCFSGFSGPDCSLPDCPGGCNNKGKCVNGTCVCDPGFTGPDCTIKTCPKNCSSHGRCVKGRCVCDTGFIGPDCSNAQCPGNCNKKGRCVNGKCECNPGFTGPECSERSCPGNCNNQGRCVNGKCVCDEGFTGSDCSERSCPGNCNKKGRCVNGKCVCNPGYTSPDCSERSCPRNCNNNGKCVKGKCVCDAGFTGPDCSELSCPGNCNKKGRCVNGQCVCNTGFTGADCSERSCPGNCNDRGQCVNGKCVCDAEFTGPDCAEQSCPGNCNDKGRCVNGKCVCDTGFTGPDCLEQSCPGNCNDKGRCVNGECVCDTGFTGADCSERSCPGNCNDNGRCVNGECVCDTGFTGADCSDRSCPGNCNDNGRCVNGECVCDTGFTGADCSERSCPGNCNDKGRCVDGECVCHTGFTGADCSERSCPGNCNDKGRCVNGKCVCDDGFTGPECSEKSCLNNCNNKGRCVDGKCVCNTGFTGQDCSERSCPGNCNNKGKCVNGRCVCEVGFTGQDCSTKTCPKNCSNKGRCVNGKCMCNPGFAEPDCSECKVGFTGSDCATELVAVSHFSARNITESSVTLVWTASTLVQYSTYHITFTSEKESDQTITATVNGAMNSYTQVGLAPGQRYTVTIVGEKDGKMGAVSTTTFQTLISGPKHLQVVKTSTTSVIVQWEEAQGEIDRYILYVSPNQTDGSGKGSQEIRLPPGRDSAQIDGLEPGRLYDISVVAEKDGTRSLPAAVQAIPDRMPGPSADVRTLDGKGPKLQNGRFEEKSIKEETTPSPSLSPKTTKIQHSLVPPETQNQPIKTSLHLPLSPKYRNSGRPKLSGSSTSPINRRPKMPGYTRPAGNVASVELPAVKKETLKGKTASQEYQPDDQDSLIEPKQGLTRDTSVRNLPEITNGPKFPKHQETANKTIPTGHHMLHRGTFPRRPNIGSNIGPFQHRTSSPHHSRIPLRRPIMPRFNSTVKNKVKPFIINTSQSNVNPNDISIFTPPGRNRTVISLAPKKNNLKADVAVDKIISKESSTVFPADNDSNPKANLSLTIDLPKRNDRVQPLTVSTENKIDPISPKVTTRDKSTARQTISLNQRVSEFISGKHNGSNWKIRPPFVQKRRNNTVIGLPSKLHTRVNVNSTTIHSLLKDSRYETRYKDAKEPSKEFQIVLPTSTDMNNFANLAFSTESPVGANETFHTISEVLENVIDQTSKESNLDGVTIRDYNVSKDINSDYRVTPKEHELPKTPTRDGDLLRVTNKDSNSSMQMLTNQKLKSNIKGHQENGPNLNVRPTLINRRKDVKFVRLPKPHTQIRPNATRTHSGPKDADTKTGSDRELSRITDKDKDLKTLQEEKNVTTVQAAIKDTDPRVEKDSRKSIAFTVQHGDVTAILPKKTKNVTVYGPTLKSKIKPNLHGDTKGSKEISTSRHTTPHRHQRPNIPQQRKNGTIIRPPPKVPQLRPNSIAIHDGTKESHKSTVGRNLGWSTGVPFSTKQRNTTHPITEVSKHNINQVEVQNVTSNGFIIIWVAPEGSFKNFVVKIAEENIGLTSNHVDLVRSNSTNDGIRKKFFKFLPGSARSYPVINLTAQTGYSVTFYGTGPGFRSNVHTINITTGPEPPSNLSFGDITDSSLTVSWRRPKSKVSGFKVTYIHTKEEEPISVTVDSSSSSVSLTKLSPGSMYEVSVISLLKLDESDPVKDIIMTLPDPPKDLRAINITDTKALLLWRPALANVDQYNITYHPEEAPGSELNIKVSGNAVEQQLHGLKSSTKYIVTIISQLGEHKSSTTHASFTTSSGSPGKGEAPRDLRAKQVTARTAVLSWKPPATAVTSYKLTYFIKGGERKEVTLNPGVSEHMLNGLHPSSTYTALLQAERGGVYTAAISTEFTTGTLRYPYPSDCSQELLNGELRSGLVEIFPGGQQGQTVKVYCDMETDGGGWTVFQRRKDGKTNFFRSWKDYKNGFGDLEGEFWIGNDILHNLTTMTPMSMRVDLRAGDESVYAHYSTFSVGTSRKHYMVRVSGYSGTAGDSMTYHDSLPFSTFDRDPQPFITRCAMSYRGGWWYRNCHEANLNGLYDTHTHHQGVIWTAWKGKKFSIPFTEMKLRPASFKPQRQG